MNKYLKVVSKTDKVYIFNKVNIFSFAETENFLKLFYECFGERKVIDELWYNWFCNGNPFGNCNNYAISEKSSLDFIGMYCLAKSQFVSNGKIYSSGIGVNGMVNSIYRNQGLYTEVISTAVQNDETDGIFFTYLHGANIGTIKGHYAAGWKTLKKVFFYSTNNLLATNSVNNIREIHSFNSIKDIETILKPKGYNAYHMRTAQWLDWRFFSKPHKKYNVFAYFDESDNMIGYIILGYYRSNINRCQILDYNAKNEIVLSALINKTKQHAILEDCNIVDLWLDDYSLEIETFKNSTFNITKEFYEVLTFSKYDMSIDINLKTVLADLDAV